MAMKRVGKTMVYYSKGQPLGNRTIYQYTSKTSWDTTPRLLIQYMTNWYEVRKVVNRYILHSQFHKPDGIHSLETGKRWSKIGRAQVYDYDTKKSLGIKTIYTSKGGSYTKVLINSQYRHVKKHGDDKWYV